METKKFSDWLESFPKGTELVVICEEKDGTSSAIMKIPKGHALTEIEKIQFPMDDVVLNVKEYSKYVGLPVRKVYHADREETRSTVLASDDYGKHRVSRELGNEGDQFEWGYVGLFPRNLARAILQDVLRDELQVDRHVTDFASRFIANLPAGKWEIFEDDVKQWVNNAEKGMLL